MKKLLLPVLLIGFAFASCQKQKQNIQASNTGAKGIASAEAMFGSSGINPENPKNPDDSIGYQHNQLVSYLFQKGYSTSTSEDSLMKWTDQFMSTFMGVSNFEQIADTPVYNTPQKLDSRLRWKNHLNLHSYEQKATAQFQRKF